MIRKYLFVILFPLVSSSQEYNLKSYKIDNLDVEEKAPNIHYLGNAWLKGIVEADTDFEYNITLATFSSDSTLDWHKHSTGQVLIIVKGEGYYQEKGKKVIKLREGDVIKCDKNIEHWHSSTKQKLVSYLAVYGASNTIWTEKLEKEYYDNIKIEPDVIKY